MASPTKVLNDSRHECSSKVKRTSIIKVRKRNKKQFSIVRGVSDKFKVPKSPVIRYKFQT